MGKGVINFLLLQGFAFVYGFFPIQEAFFQALHEPNAADLRGWLDKKILRCVYIKSR